MLGPELVQTASRAPPRTVAPSALDGRGVGAAPACQWSRTRLPVEPITSLSWWWVGAREAREQFLGMRKPSPELKVRARQANGTGAGLPSLCAAKALGSAPSEVPPGSPEGAELVCVLGVGSRLRVQSPPSLGPSLLWL